MYTAVVKFDPLADPVGTAAQDNNLLFIANPAFVQAGLVGGVEVGPGGKKFAGAGVHQLVGGVDLQLLAPPPDGQLIAAQDAGQLVVGEAGFLGLPKQHRGQLLQAAPVKGQLFFQLQDLLHLVKEPGVDPGIPVDLLHGKAFLQGVADIEDALVVGEAQLFLD